jgi:lysozyme family protein
MSNYKEIVPFFYKWEGGLSNDKNDSASSNQCPTPYKGVKGYHTNKGVTYNAWKYTFGTTNDARFYEMNNEDWGVIFKLGYWDKVKGDKIQFQSIANVLVSWAWGSGSGTSVKQMQKVLGVSVDGIIGNQTINAIHACNELELFDKCVIARGQFFESIAKRNPKNLKFLKGWMNRLNDFNTKFKPV